MCCPGPAVPTPAEPLSFFIAVPFSFLTFPFRTPTDRTDPCRAAQFFYSRAGPVSTVF